MRCVLRAVSRTSCLRVRISARRSWIGVGGTKLPRMRPCANRSAIQVASFTSVLRPGTFLMCAAFARTSWNFSSRMCQTGFQYTPVASIATCVHASVSSHADNSSRPVVVVSNVRTSSVSLLSSTMRAHATTVRWCTSRPAQRLYINSTGHSFAAAAWDPRGAKSSKRAPGPCRPWQQFGVRVGSRVRLAIGLVAPWKTPTSMPPQPQDATPYRPFPAWRVRNGWGAS